LEEGLVFAQLRDMFATEDSAVVAKEDEDGGMRFPEGAEANLVAEGVGECDAGEALAEGIGHAEMIEEEKRRVKGGLLARSECGRAGFLRSKCGSRYLMIRVAVVL
jgi:hypothetical protein